MNRLSKFRSSSSNEAANPWDDTVVDWPPPFEPLQTNRNRVENSAASSSLDALTEEEEDWGALGRS